MIKFNSFLLALILLVFSFSCGNASEENNTNSADTLAKKKIDTSKIEILVEDSTQIDSLPQSDSLFKVQFPQIDSIAEYALFRDSIIDYFNQAFTIQITQQSQIEAVFTFRDKLIQRMNELSYHYNENIESEYKKWDAYHVELVKFGFRPIYAEGMFTGLAIAPLFEKEIKAICSQEYQLFVAFKLAEANSFGGEYPYVDLTSQIEMLLLGEKMARKFPKSEYNAFIEEPYHFALSTLTDFHGIARNGKVEEYLLQGISRDFWPYATDISFTESFVKKHPKSKFAKAIKKILENPSELELGEDSNIGSVFLVVIESHKDKKVAENRVFELLSKGFDIPHVISSKKENIEQFNLVYRFYSSKEKAEKALAKINLKFKEAKLIHIDFQWNEIEE